jgi:hypothetical protein
MNDFSQVSNFVYVGHHTKALKSKADQFHIELPELLKV